VRIPTETLSRLRCAATEHGQNTAQHAAYAIEAAARLWRADPRTSAVPRHMPASLGVGEINLNLPQKAVVVAGVIADERGVNLEAVLSGLLSQSVADYDAEQPARRTKLARYVPRRYRPAEFITNLPLPRDVTALVLN